MRAPAIEFYSFGSIQVDGELYREDIIIFPDGVRTVWRRKEGHSLIPEDIPEVLETSPDLLIIGTGKHGRMKVSDEAREAVKKAGIELVEASTDKAIDAYMSKRDKKPTVAALHLTC